MTFSNLPKTTSFLTKCGILALALTFALSIPVETHAKPGGGGSMGSRGTRTYSAPAATPTAPRTAAPIERSATPAPSISSPSSASSPQVAASSRPRFGTGMMAGLLGAGLLGAVLGHGFAGGLGGLMSVIGMVIQFALIAGIVMFAIRWFRNRSAASAVSASATVSPNTMRRESANFNGLMGNAGRSPPPRLETNRPVQIGPADFAAFEKLLNDIQTSYGAEDINAIKAVTTSEMASYFSSELDDNTRKGYVNRITDVKLLQGDLSESWGEPGVDYATVAMCYALNDVMLDRASNKPIPGHNNGPQEATELWTFIRQAAGSWKLSAIQQAG